MTDDAARSFVIRYEATWDPVAYWASTPWCVRITTMDHVYSALGRTEADAMDAAFNMLPGLPEAVRTARALLADLPDR